MSNMKANDQLSSAFCYYLSQINAGINGIVELSNTKGTLLNLTIKEVDNSIVLQTKANEAVVSNGVPEIKEIRVTFKNVAKEGKNTSTTSHQSHKGE